MRRRKQRRGPRPPRKIITLRQQAEIFSLGEALYSFGPYATSNRLSPLPERLDAKARLVHAVASASFGEEALSYEHIRAHLDVDERRFLASVLHDRPAKLRCGPFDAITGVFALSEDESREFINQQNRDWDDLHVADSFAPKDAPCNLCIGVNVVVSIPYICGKAQFSLDLAMAALVQHIRLVAGPVNIFGSHPDAPTPYLLTTVTRPEQTYHWAEELGMEFVATTDHHWTKAVTMQQPSGELSFAEQWAKSVCEAIAVADVVTFY